jgi:hypothetical protein
MWGKCVRRLLFAFVNDNQRGIRQGCVHSLNKRLRGILINTRISITSPFCGEQSANLIARSLTSPNVESIRAVWPNDILVALSDKRTQCACIPLARLGDFLNLLFWVRDRTRPVDQERERGISRKSLSVSEVTKFLKERRDNVFIFELWTIYMSTGSKRWGNVRSTNIVCVNVTVPDEISCSGCVAAIGQTNSKTNTGRVEIRRVSSEV